MGLSGGSSSTSTSGSAQQWAQPIAAGAADMGTGIVNQTQPLLNQLTNSMSSMLPGLTQDYANNQAMMANNASYLNGMASPLSAAFGQNYGQMQGLMGDVGYAGSQALGAYGGPNAATATLPGLFGQIGASDPNLAAAGNYTQGVLGGQYMNGNPYLDAALQRTRQDVTNDVNSQFSAAGRYGSGAQTDVMTRRLSDAENQVRMADYNAQMGRMDQAAQTAAGLSQTGAANQASSVNNYLNAANADNSINNTAFGQGMTAAGMAPTLAQASYAGLNPLLQTMGSAADQANASYAALPQILAAYGATGAMPLSAYSTYSNGLGTLMNGGTQTQKQDSNILGDLLSAGAKVGSAAIAASDRRLKRDIEKLGEHSDGLGIYEWTYVVGGPRVRGVMADEVEKLRPWALGPMVGNYKTVNYAALEVV